MSDRDTAVCAVAMTAACAELRAEKADESIFDVAGRVVDAAYREGHTHLEIECEPTRFVSVARRAWARPSCECGGNGPHARKDGWRYDSAGDDFPCPDCGATARQAQEREARVGGGS